MTSISTPWSLAPALLAALLSLNACGGGHDGTVDAGPEPEPPESGCWVELFDGDHFSDDRILVEGPGEFARLDELPGSDKSWDDEADSFRSGAQTRVTFWTQTNFAGESSTHEGESAEPSIDEPRAMKIECL